MRSYVRSEAAELRGACVRRPRSMGPMLGSGSSSRPDQIRTCESFEVDFSMQQAVVRCSAFLYTVKSLKNGYPKVVPAAGVEKGTMGSVPGGDTKLTGSKK